MDNLRHHVAPLLLIFAQPERLLPERPFLLTTIFIVSASTFPSEMSHLQPNGADDSIALTVLGCGELANAPKPPI